MFPSLNISNLVPFSHLSGYGTFFLLHLNCRSMDYLIKGSYSSAQVWGYLHPSVVHIHSPSLVTWPLFVCLAFVHLRSCIYQRQSFLCSPSGLFFHNCPSSSGLETPLASKKPCRPKTYSLFCILTHLVISVTT